MILSVKRTNPNAVIPYKENLDDKCFVLCAPEECTIAPMENKLINLGIQVLLPEKTEAQIRPLCELVSECNIEFLSTPSIITRSYKDDLQVHLMNLSMEDFVVTKGMEIAKFTVYTPVDVEIEAYNELVNDAVEGENCCCSKHK